jgi:ABC-2 type transport system permease protein
MPPPLQWFTFINPRHSFLVVIRAVFLQDTGVSVLWPEFAARALLGGVLRFPKSLD